MAFNPLQNFLGGQQAGREQQAFDVAGRLAQSESPQLEPEFQRLMQLDPAKAKQFSDIAASGDASRANAMIKDAKSFKWHLQNGNADSARELLLNRSSAIGGRPSQDTDELRNILDTKGPEAAIVAVDGFLGLFDPNAKQGAKKEVKTAGQREFESLTQGLTDEQNKQARLIELGLSPRAVGSAVQTITDQGIAEQIGKAKATIKQREKFGELTANSRAKTIDAGIEKISKIDLGLNNINRAVALLNDGAGVGAIQKFLPSFRASSVALDNVQKSMALDVIGAVTFGALSEGELNLAKEVALPTGLDSQQLIQHLQDRKSAQEKLRGYFNEQIQFLDQGGTVAGFLRQRERDTQQESSSEQATTGQTFNFDAQGNLIQ